MGQQIGVIEKSSSNPGVVRFEANRNLTGMGHEVFHSVAEAIGSRPAAALARNLLSTGQVATGHVFGNMITGDLAKGCDSAGLGEVVRTYTTVSRQGGQLKLVNLTKRIEDLLSITKLLTVFETFDTEAEALNSFK